MADILFFTFVLYGLVFGMRRGFYKELVAVCALVVGVGAARVLRDPVGDLLHDKFGVGVHTGQLLGTLVTWVVVVLVVNIVGRLALRRLRNPDAEGRLEGAAQAAVDSVEGKPKPGPVTFLTNPIATAEKGLVYWSDKILGGALGVLKGVVAAYVIFAIVYYSDKVVGANWSFTQSIVDSKAKALYSAYFDALFRSLPEYRIVENLAILEGLENDPKIDGPALERMAADPRWSRVKTNEAFMKVASDPDVQKAWEQRLNGKRDIHAVIHLSMVRGLIADSDFRSSFADVDLGAIRDEALKPPPPSK